MEVGSDLLDIENQALWLQLNNVSAYYSLHSASHTRAAPTVLVLPLPLLMQSEIAESIVGLFAAIDEIGQTLLNEGSVSGSLNISTNNIGETGEHI